MSKQPIDVDAIRGVHSVVRSQLSYGGLDLPWDSSRSKQSWTLKRFEDCFTEGCKLLAPHPRKPRRSRLLFSSPPAHVDGYLQLLDYHFPCFLLSRDALRHHPFHSTHGQAQPFFPGQCQFNLELKNSFSRKLGGSNIMEPKRKLKPWSRKHVLRQRRRNQNTCGIRK